MHATTATTATTDAVKLRDHLLRDVADPASLVALLAHIGSDVAAGLTRDEVGTRLDHAGASRLLGRALPSGGVHDEAGGRPLAEHHWAPTVATLSDDRDTLTRLAQAAAEPAQPIGWAMFPTLANRLAANPALDLPTRCWLAAVTNPFDRDNAASDLLAETAPTREVVAALLRAGRQVGHVTQFLDTVAGSPLLGSETAGWLLEELASDCAELGAQVTAARIVDRSDHLALAGRAEPQMEASEDASAGDGDVHPSPIPDGSAGDGAARVRVERYLARLAHLTAAHMAPGHRCELGGNLWRGLYFLLIDPAVPTTEDVFDVVRGLSFGPYALGQRVDLPPGRYAELAAEALATADEPATGSLADNPACPLHLLENAPVSHVGMGYLSRLALAYIGDGRTDAEDTGEDTGDGAPVHAGAAVLVALLELVASDRIAGLSAAAAIELAAQTVLDPDIVTASRS